MTVHARGIILECDGCGKSAPIATELHDVTGWTRTKTSEEGEHAFVCQDFCLECFNLMTDTIAETNKR